MKSKVITISKEDALKYYKELTGYHETKDERIPGIVNRGAKMWDDGWYAVMPLEISGRRSTAEIEQTCKDLGLKYIVVEIEHQNA